jgi:hypothetical protein
MESRLTARLIIPNPSKGSLTSGSIKSRILFTAARQRAIASPAIIVSGTGNRHAKSQPDTTTDAIALIGKDTPADQSP